mgnify:CR=1 FL=1
MKKQWFSLVVCILLVGISYASVTANQSNDLNTPEEPEPSGTLRQVLLTVADAPQVGARVPPASVRAVLPLHVLLLEEQVKVRQ